MTLAQLVANLQSTMNAVSDAEKVRDAANKRLLDGLAAINKPLHERGSVVIGDVLIKRPYPSLTVEMSKVMNLSPDVVVEI